MKPKITNEILQRVQLNRKNIFHISAAIVICFLIACKEMDGAKIVSGQEGKGGMLAERVSYNSTSKSQDDGEDVEGEKKARVFHGSLTMKDLHPATRWESSKAILSSQLLLLFHLQCWFLRLFLLSPSKATSWFLASLTLTPTCRYKVRVASRNAFGFNNPEDVFVFATKGAGGIFSSRLIMIPRV